MKLSIGIVGLPNVGKSTLFKLLTNNDIHIANYPFATIDPNVGVVSVPDERLNKLTEISNSKKTIPAIIEFYDIAGLVKGAASGAGLGNQFLTHIRDVSAVVHVLRVFKSEEIIHVENSIHPLRDKEIINTELALKDLETIERRMKKADTEVRGGSKKTAEEVEILKEIKMLIDAGKSTVKFANHIISRQLGLLSVKPKLYLLNGNKEDVSEELEKSIKEEGSEYVIMNLSQESDLSNLIKGAYSLLGLMSFFTTGEDESRAWTIKKESSAPQAAGAIHTDFENKFIRAEVISYTDFVENNGWNSTKQKGKLRTEGKEYVVQEGDIMNILHS